MLPKDEREEGATRSAIRVSRDGETEHAGQVSPSQYVRAAAPQASFDDRT